MKHANVWKNTCATANENAQVQFTQSKGTCMHCHADAHVSSYAACVSHHAVAVEQCLVCTRVHLQYMLTSLIFHAHARFVTLL